MKKIIFYAIVFFPTCVFSQAYNPLFKTHFLIANDSAQILTNYQVLLVVNTAAPISAGHMRADGGDIRFTENVCSPVVMFDYWIEDFLNTDSTRIWVKIPSLPANSISQFVLWSGDTNAVAQSDFNTTFPHAYISAGFDTVLSGNVYFDWFQLDSGDVVDITPGSPLSIRSRVIKMNGTINGNGGGNPAPLGISAGNGPGGGGTSPNAGAGGGSFAGLGGTGGMDAGDTPGAGGSVYGLSNDLQFEMGSSGGTTDNAMGGNGGGALCLISEWMDISGQITVNGKVGVGSTGRCGGGGSGGSIVLVGEYVHLTGASILTASGGNGGNGTVAANDGGGGGSGGRIKIFYEQDFVSSANLSVLGGLGGLFGSFAYGTNGENGSYIDTAWQQPSVHLVAVSSEYFLEATILGLDSIYCLNKDSVHLTALPPGGNFSGPGVLSDYFNPLAAGVGTHAISYVYNDPFGCGSLYDTVFVTVINVPIFPLATSNSPICHGDTLILIASDSAATHVWSGPNGFSSTSQFPFMTDANTLASGNYSVTITYASGCLSTVVTSVVVHPIPNVTVTNNAPICLTQALSFAVSGGAAYSWSGPNGFSSGLQSPVVLNTQFTSQGTYTVTVSDANGCQTTVTTEVQVDGCYDGVEDVSNSVISVYPNPAWNEVWIELSTQPTVQETRVEVYDASGRMVGNKNLPRDLTLWKFELDTFPPGTYFLRVYTDSQSPSNFKVIKQ
jgi:hypothetical protein